MDDGLIDPFRRLLDEISPPAAVRAAQAGGDTGAMWRALRDSGFIDALVSEENGGAGLAPGDVARLLIVSGRALLPVAFADTVVARALVAAAGVKLTIDTPALLWPLDDTGRLCSLVAPARNGAAHALVQQGQSVRLVALENKGATPDGFGIVPATLAADAKPLLEFELPADTLRNIAAAAQAAVMAGAMTRVLEMTLDHVNDRQQFGRPLGKFQAIQQQIAMMAEQVAAAGVAAQLAFRGPALAVSTVDAAIAKTVCNDAAGVVCAAAHAAHGAIGITLEHDLSLYARHLKRGQLTFGASSYWTAFIGEARLAANVGTSVDFLRAR